jgi:hypothetical protein
MRPFVAPENPMRLIGGNGSPEEPHLSPGNALDLSDPDVSVLPNPHGTALARFGARGATAEAREREARKDHRERNLPA